MLFSFSIRWDVGKLNIYFGSAPLPISSHFTQMHLIFLFLASHCKIVHLTVGNNGNKTYRVIDLKTLCKGPIAGSAGSIAIKISRKCLALAIVLFIMTFQ